MKKIEPKVREYAIKKIEKNSEEVKHEKSSRNFNILIASVYTLAALNYYLCDEIVLAGLHTSVAMLYAGLANDYNNNIKQLSKETNNIEYLLKHSDTDNNIGGMKR